MDKKIKVRGTITEDVTIDIKEAFYAIKRGLGFETEYGKSIHIRDGILVERKDVAYHGSAYFEYREISNNPKWIELYQSILLLEEYMEHSDDSIWKRHIEKRHDKDDIEVTGRNRTVKSAHGRTHRKEDCR